MTAAKARASARAQSENAWSRPKSPHPDRPDSWPVIWRIVMPAAGSYNLDWVVMQTDDEAAARKSYRVQRAGGWPVRLERVSCGPLPKAATDSLAKLRSANAQHPGAKMPAVLGYWERP